MIINLHFGYAGRHHVYYDTQLKRGTIKLWASHNGSITAGPVELDTDQHTEFLITDENDTLSLLASLEAVIRGEQLSFTSKEGRKITLSMEKSKKRGKEAITAHIQYGKAGKLTMGEARKLHAIAWETLSHLGYADQEISEKLKRITTVLTKGDMS